MKRASYREAVRWIALNEDSDEDPAEMCTTFLVADIFGVSPEKVAADIRKVREKEPNGGSPYPEI